MRPTASDSSPWPPGSGSAERRRWNSRSNRSSSTHTGRPRLPGTWSARWRRRGARWIRASMTRRTSSKSNGPSERGSRTVSAATCMWTAGRSRYRKEASRDERRSGEGVMTPPPYSGSRRAAIGPSVQLDPHALEALALGLGLHDTNGADLGRGAHVRAAVGLLVEALDVDHPDRVDVVGDQVHLGADQIGIGERVGARQEAHVHGK